MEGAGDDFLACSGFSQNQHVGVGGRYGLHLGQYALQGGALADDLFEVMLGLDLVFEIELLVGQVRLSPSGRKILRNSWRQGNTQGLRRFIFQFGNLEVGQGVLDRNRNLVCDLLK